MHICTYIVVIETHLNGYVDDDDDESLQGRI